MSSVLNSSSRIYRLDKFVVPKTAREEFLARVRQTHALLRNQPGFVRDILLEKPATGGNFTVVTLVEWQDADSVQRAREAIADMHREAGFTPRELLDRLGIEADIGNYTSIHG